MQTIRPPLPVADHPLGCRLDREEDAGQVDIDLVLPILERHVEDGPTASDARVGDSDVKAAQLADASVGRGLHLLLAKRTLQRTT